MKTIGEALDYDVPVTLKAYEWNTLRNILVDVVKFGFLDDGERNETELAQALLDRITEQMNEVLK